MSYLLHSSTSEQQSYAKSAADDGVFKYSLEFSNEIWKKWYERVFDYISLETGVVFESDSSSPDIRYYAEIVSSENFDQAYSEDTIQRLSRDKFNTWFPHDQVQYGGVTSQSNVSKTILRSLGLSFPNGVPYEDNYNYNNTLLSTNSVNNLTAGRSFAPTSDDLSAVDTLLPGSANLPKEFQYHNSSIQEDLLLGRNGQVDYFILSRKGLDVSENAPRKFISDGGYYEYNRYLNASVGNFNPVEGDRILIPGRHFSPYTFISDSRDQSWRAKNASDVSISLTQTSLTYELGLSDINEDKLTFQSDSNLIYNDAGKLMLNVNGRGPSTGDKQDLAGANMQMLGFIDLHDTHYAILESKYFQSVDFDYVHHEASDVYLVASSLLNEFTDSIKGSVDVTDQRRIKVIASSWTDSIKIDRAVNSSSFAHNPLQGKQIDKNNWSGPSGSVIAGSSGDDVLRGLAGWDLIEGGAGNDLVHGGNGRDVIGGGQGSDELHGDFGWNTFLDQQDGSKDLIAIKSDQHLSNWWYGKAGNSPNGEKADFIEGLDATDEIKIIGVFTPDISVVDNVTARGVTGIGIYAKGTLEAVYTGGNLSTSQIQNMTTGDGSTTAMNNQMWSYWGDNTVPPLQA